MHGPFFLCWNEHSKYGNRVFHKLSIMQEWQYCHLDFSCAIRKELVQWSLKPSNIMLLHPLMSNFTFTTNKKGNSKNMGIQSWWKCQYCQFCAFVKKRIENNRNQAITRKGSSRVWKETSLICSCQVVESLKTISQSVQSTASQCRLKSLIDTPSLNQKHRFCVLSEMTSVCLLQ